MRAKSLIVAALLFLAMAGCTDTSTPASPSMTDGPQQPVDARVSSREGAIEGVALDSSQLPLANVTVVLFEGGMEGAELGRTSTGADGAFSFSLLAPATYRLAAEAAGYGVATLLVTVVEGEISTARLVLVDVPAKVPYVTVLVKVGRLSCAYALIVTPTGGNCRGEPVQWIIVYEIPEGYVRILSEATWRGSEQLAQYFYVDNESTNSGVTTKTLAELWGKSPLRITFSPGEAKKSASQNPLFAASFTGLPNGSKFGLNISTYYVGQYADEINATLNPACRYVYGRCAGVGATLDLRWTQYVSLFVNGLPTDVDTYSAIPREGSP